VQQHTKADGGGGGGGGVTIGVGGAGLPHKLALPMPLTPFGCADDDMRRTGSVIYTPWSPLEKPLETRDEWRGRGGGGVTLGGGAGGKLLFTTVDDLTGWLQQHAEQGGVGGGEYGRDKLLSRPTSSPDVMSRSGILSLLALLVQKYKY
jgi:hypothetical protein